MFHFSINFLIFVFSLFVFSENVLAQECVDLRGEYSCKFQKEGLLYDQAVLQDGTGNPSLLKAFDEYSFELQASQSIDEGFCVFHFVNVSNRNLSDVMIADEKLYSFNKDGKNYDTSSFSSQQWLKTVTMNRPGRILVNTNQLDENGALIIEAHVVDKNHIGDIGKNNDGVHSSGVDSDRTDNIEVKKYIDETVKKILHHKKVCVREESS